MFQSTLSRSGSFVNLSLSVLLLLVLLLAGVLLLLRVMLSVILLSVLLLLLLLAGALLLGRSALSFWLHLLLLLLRALVVVVMVTLEKFLAELLLAFVNILIKSVTVFTDRELLVIVNRDMDLLLTDRFVLRAVELCHVRVSQSLFRG